MVWREDWDKHKRDSDFREWLIMGMVTSKLRHTESFGREILRIKEMREHGSS